MNMCAIAQSYSHPSHARIGYVNLLTATTTTAAEATLTPDTYQRYTPATGSVTTKWQLAEDAEIDFIGIAAHNFGTHESGGVPFLIQYATTVGGALTDIEELRPGDNRAIMHMIDPVTVREIAITHNVSISGLEYGVVFAGKSLEMPRPIYGGHNPINLSHETEYQSTMSETGQFLGRSIIRKGLSSSYKWQNIDPDWYRLIFEPFVQSARTLPFFLKWRPDLFPNETVYGYTTTDITANNQGGGVTLMNIDLSMRGHADN